MTSEYVSIATYCMYNVHGIAPAVIVPLPLASNVWYTLQWTSQSDVRSSTCSTIFDAGMEISSLSVCSRTDTVPLSTTPATGVLPRHWTNSKVITLEGANCCCDIQRIQSREEAVILPGVCLFPHWAWSSLRYDWELCWKQSSNLISTELLYAKVTRLAFE